MSDKIDAQLNFAIKNGMNVMLSGKHGVGKTARINDAMKRHDIKFIYFSGSTMDPFVDFIGVPKEMTDPKTGEVYLGFVRPQALMDDELEAIFIDEYNRSDKGVRNAVMELIQFKSINGRKFPNLKYVWTAINPDDDDDFNYDTEQLDPAQADRFQMQIEVPYDVSASYFIKKYPDVGASVAEWWKSLSKKQKNVLSPRRLDYACHAYVNCSASKTMLSSILPNGINVSDFVTALVSGSLKTQLKNAYDSKDKDSLCSIVNGSETRAVVNNIDALTDGDEKFFEVLCHAANDETFIRIVTDYSVMTRKVLQNNPNFAERMNGFLSLTTLDDVTRTQIEVLLGGDTKQQHKESEPSLGSFWNYVDGSSSTAGSCTLTVDSSTTSEIQFPGDYAPWS